MWGYGPARLLLPLQLHFMLAGPPSEERVCIPTGPPHHHQWHCRRLRLRNVSQKSPEAAAEICAPDLQCVAEELKAFLKYVPREGKKALELREVMGAGPTDMGA